MTWGCVLGTPLLVGFIPKYELLFSAAVGCRSASANCSVAEAGGRPRPLEAIVPLMHAVQLQALAWSGMTAREKA